MNIALDTNCFIDAANGESFAHDAMTKIIDAYEKGRISIFVSRHTLSELSRRPDAALGLAEGFSVLPHWSLGSWAEQVATWNQITGSWEEADRNNEAQIELEHLANTGNDIRDRGAYIDALRANIDVFVTSDKQLVARGPAARIQERFGLRVMKPDRFLIELSRALSSAPGAFGA